jgi:GT2 family glycosyltransferase
MIEIVSATRLSKKEFWNTSALGLSLKRLTHDKRLVWRLHFENRFALPTIYNARISAEDRNEVVVFIHDDVWIDDEFFADRILEGLESYDVLGVAGNRRRIERQPNWAFIDTKLTWDDSAYLSGAVSHGKSSFGPVSNYGETPAECELLDGVFLAAKTETLNHKNALFDPRFDFHFYDLDFCRRARQRGLTLGTWPISLTHQSGGAFGTPNWKQKYRAYIEKWGE